MMDKMKRWQKQYPPYEGPEPYLYLAFADGDTRKVWPVMKVLLKRGCRVWYCTGPAGSSQELLHRQERAAGAAWTLLYLTDALAADKESKSRIMVNQKAQKPIACLDTDGVNRYLAMDIRESTPSIALHHCKNDAALEDALIRTEGYTQNIVGKPVKIKSNWLGKLTRTFILLTVLMLGAAVWLARQVPVYEDTVPFSDPVIREAARAAAGGGPLSEDSLQGIESLYLTELPETWEDLSLLPDLQQLEISQDMAAQADTLPMDAYRIVLYGGGS